MIILTALLAIFMIVAQSARKVQKRPERDKTFTVKQKLEVVNFAASHNFCVAAKYYSVSRTTIQSWSHQVGGQVSCEARFGSAATHH
jgi:hypothetical protein